ncbi:MAG: hypothetical protein KJ061_18440 [Vicinamibacteraceae bacterium]|nr:hypothetical protein [Vicinamibacteraceae bacterium]
MRRCRFGVGLVLSAFLSLPGPLFASAIVKKMDLAEVCARADRIFRGTIVDVVEGSVAAGGGQLPTVTYRIRVTETFKGDVLTKDGVSYAEVTMIGRAKPALKGGMQHFSALPEMPRYEKGGDYLLMVTAPSAIGLSAPVGLAQGSYTISSRNKVDMAQNALGQLLKYDDLADRIRALLKQ